MTVRQTIMMERKQRILVKWNHLFSEAIRQQLGPFSPPQADLLVASAGAIAGEHRHFMSFLVFAAIGNTFIAMLEATFLQAAATGMVGSSLGGTPADIAVARTFAGYGVGDNRGAHGERRKGTHGDH